MQLALPKLSQPLRLWEKIELVVGDDREVGHYLAKIEDFINDGIVISEPEFTGGKTLLRENAPITIIVAREDAVYQCQSRIRKLQSRGRSMFLLTPPAGVKRVQRRLFVRVEMLADIQYADLPNVMDWEDFEDRLEWKDTRSVDISGGGMLLKTAEAIKKDDRLLLKIPFFDELEIPHPLAAVCRRAFERENQNYAGVEYITADRIREFFSESDFERLPRSVGQFSGTAQNRLVNFVFQRQVELRKKGLL